jgi:DNA-binding LacI/PurR family transcriptional regulator
MTTIIDVAKAAGVSKSTVSRVFTNPGAVKPYTMERVNKAAQKLDYMPNALARAMITKKTETLAFIIFEGQFPVITNPFYGQILEGIAEQSRQKGYGLYISSAGAVRGDAFRIILQKQVDGVFFASYTDPAMLRSALTRGIPVTLINSKTNLPGVCNVLSDDQGGIEQIVSYLAQKGHADIGIIEGKFTQFVFDRRHNAFLKSFRKHGLEANPKNRAIINVAVQDALDAAYSILSARNPPSALICANDTIAAGAIKAARRLGMKAPGDVAITGYDNSSLCIACEPSITSVDANTGAMSAAAVDFLFRQIGGEKIKNVTRTVKTKLISWESA